MAHVFDLASNWPADTNLMILQGWYGIPEGEGGPEDDFGVWDIGASSTWHGSNPSAYPRIPYDVQDASVSNGGERFIGSHYRPLEGLYSTSGRDAASIAHIDRELAVVRRAGDPRGRIDVLCPTLGHLGFTSAASVAEDHEDFNYGLDRRYRHYIALLDRASEAGLTNCIAPNLELYQVWQNYSAAYSTKALRLLAVASDLQRLVEIAKVHPAAFKVDGRVVVLIYEGALTEDISSTEWNATFEEVRKTYDAGTTPATDPNLSQLGTGHDFYTIGRNYGAGDVAAYDGLLPWVRLDIYDDVEGTPRQKAAGLAEQSVTDFIQAAVTSNPTRIALANFTPGFESWVKGWGAGIEEGFPRSTDTIRGHFDGYAAIESGWQRPDGIVVVTWDDYPEGTVLEPTTADRGEFLALWTEQVAEWEGDTPDPSETQALLDIFLAAEGVSTASPTIQPTQPGPHVRRARRIAPRGPA